MLKEKKGYEQILKSMLPPEQRNFSIVYDDQHRFARWSATYLPRTRVITIYLRQFDYPLDVVAAGLHEIAHHLAWRQFEQNAPTRRIKHHGKEFRRTLAMLVAEFNSRYRELVRGEMVFNPRSPRGAPSFKPWTLLDQSTPTAELSHSNDAAGALESNCPSCQDSSYLLDDNSCDYCKAVEKLVHEIIEHSERRSFEKLARSARESLRREK